MVLVAVRVRRALFSWQERYLPGYTRRPLMSAEDEERIRHWLDTSMTPDEYAARNAHRWLCFSLHEYRYADRSLEAWIVRFANILFHEGDAPTLDELRTRYLSTSERKVIARELAASFQPQGTT